MLRIRNIKLKINESEKNIDKKLSKALKCNPKEIISWSINKKALDSRRKDNIKYIYTIDVKVKNETKYKNLPNVSVVEEFFYTVEKVNSDIRPVVVGSGPAGLFTALILAEANLKPIIIEQGKNVDQRKIDVDTFMKTGTLKPDSNIQFGAGGAGTFSDGKLTTGVNDRRREKLMRELIEAGAPKEIEYLSKAHIGTDILIEVVKNLCLKIEQLGGEFMFSTKFIDFETENNKLKTITIIKNNVQEILPCTHLILALGHSARDTFEMLYKNSITMKAKPFSVGVRIEHPQSAVDLCQYGDLHTSLDTASYKLSTHLDDGRAVYTFCMCPGGVVVPASSEPNRLCTNGMSYYARDLENANSALLVSITPEDFEGDKHPLNGMYFQRKLEEQAFILGGSNYFAPAQRVEDFLLKQPTIEFSKVIPSYQPGVTPTDLHNCLPDFISDALSIGINDLAKKMSVFNNPDAVLTAIESRSSSPVTILRDENFMSNIYGTYPCGEGAGYAGGIVSAAIDGIKCAEQVLKNIISEEKFE